MFIYAPTTHHHHHHISLLFSHSPSHLGLQSSLNFAHLILAHGLHLQHFLAFTVDHHRRELGKLQALLSGGELVHVHLEGGGVLDVALGGFFGSRGYFSLVGEDEDVLARRG